MLFYKELDKCDEQDILKYKIEWTERFWDIIYTKTMKIFFRIIGKRKLRLLQAVSSSRQCNQTALHQDSAENNKAFLK